MGKQSGSHGKQHRINRMITSPYVRLVGDNVKPGVYPLHEALKIAESMNMDLVEVAISNNESICRIMDYNKYLYQKKKQKKEDKHGKSSILKEIRITTFTSDHDLEIKARQAREFLMDHNKVKISLIMKGMDEMVINLSKEKINKIVSLLSDVAKTEGEPKQEGRRFVVTLAPKSK